MSVTTPRRRGVIQKLVYSIHKFLLKRQLKTAIKLCLNSQSIYDSAELFSQFSHLKRSNLSLSLEDLSSIINIAWPVIHSDIKALLASPKSSTWQDKEDLLRFHIKTMVDMWSREFNQGARIKNSASLEESSPPFVIIAANI